MIQISVTTQRAAELHELAAQDARSVEQLIEEAIDNYVSFRCTEPELTSAQIDRIKHGVEQLNRGEVVDQDQVEAFFKDWEREIASR